jgi:hypothetical protein
MPRAKKRGKGHRIGTDGAEVAFFARSEPTMHPNMSEREYARRRIWEAEGVIAILGKMDAERLPPAESRAVGECQARAVESWLAAYLDLADAEKSGGRSRFRTVRL